MRFPLSLRLAILPVLAGVTVIVLSAVSISDLERSPSERRRRAAIDRASDDRLQVLERRKPDGDAVRFEEVPELSESEAVSSLEREPNRRAIAHLWPLHGYREWLFDVLLSDESSEEVRLYLLGRFEAEAPDRAIEAARLIARQEGTAQGPLRLAAYEILSRHGERRDLVLLEARPSERHQTTAQREEYRRALVMRLDDK